MQLFSWIQSGKEKMNHFYFLIRFFFQVDQCAVTSYGCSDDIIAAMMSDNGLVTAADEATDMAALR